MPLPQPRVDNGVDRTYAALMDRGEPFIRLTLDVDQAIELGEFVGAFTALASEYERFVRANQPSGPAPEATLFVKEVRSGSVIADLVPWVGLTLAGGVIEGVGHLNTVDEFVERLGNRLRAYTKPGGRVSDATKSELSDFYAQVGAVANAPGSTLQVAAMERKSGKDVTRAYFQFDTGETRQIQQRIEEHRNELNHTNRADHERVLMTFVRPDIRGASVGKRSGELVEIAKISDNPRPLIYASEMAGQTIKAEMQDDDSVFKKGFVVDVNVEMRRGKPVAYAVTNVHQVIEID